MDEELVGDSSVDEYGNTEEDGEGRPLSFSKQFEEVFPWYLSIGMTVRQFWDDDAVLAKYFREAERCKEDAFNRQAHLQGLYIYEALCDVAPVLNAFAKKGTKPSPYPEKPYDLKLEYVSEEENEKSSEQKKMEANKAKMEAFMVSFNRQFKAKQAKEEMTNG